MRLRNIPTLLDVLSHCSLAPHAEQSPNQPVTKRELGYFFTSQKSSRIARQIDRVSGG